MSGGAFDYQQYKIGEIADQIEEEIRRYSGDQRDDWDFEMKPKTISRLKDAVRALRVAEIYAQRADWFFSGDDSEESFHERLGGELGAFDEAEEARNG